MNAPKRPELHCPHKPTSFAIVNVRETRVSGFQVSEHSLCFVATLCIGPKLAPRQDDVCHARMIDPARPRSWRLELRPSVPALVLDASGRSRGLSVCPSVRSRPRPSAEARGTVLT